MSLRAAINAKCKDCICDRCAPGTWREQVAACSAIRCPLWPVRPAATVGPLADPPRDPATVPPNWTTVAIACLKSGQRSPESQEDGQAEGPGRAA